jgi:hypothetical protein
MTRHGFSAAACAAVIAATAGVYAAATTPAAATSCTGPFRQCAIEVGAFCEFENGKMMIWYKDREGASSRFEDCIGKVFEANGKPNRYRPASAQKPKPAR